MSLVGKRPRILLLAAIYSPPYSGAGYLAQLLRDSSFAQVFELQHLNATFVDSIAELQSVSLFKAWLFVKYFGLLAKALLTQRPDFVIICPAFGRAAFAKDSIYTLVCAKLFRRRVIWWCHAWGADGLFQGASPWMRKYIRWTAAATAAIVTVGGAQRRDFARLCEPTKLKTIHSGVPVQTFAVDHISDGPVSVLYFANLETTKGWRLLLEAAREICERRPRVVFDFYGNPAKDSSALDIAAAFNGGAHANRIRYHGPAYGQEKRRAFEQADIFCFPTYFPVETFGLVNLEAMNAALPIVSTWHAGIPEAVADGLGGLLVPTQDVKGLTRALLTLIDDPGLRLRMGRHNQQRFTENFTAIHFVQRWIDLVSSLGASAQRPV